jgi:hypothetical protein
MSPGCGSFTTAQMNDQMNEAELGGGWGGLQSSPALTRSARKRRRMLKDPEGGEEDATTSALAGPYTSPPSIPLPVSTRPVGNVNKPPTNAPTATDRSDDEEDDGRDVSGDDDVIAEDGEDDVRAENGEDDENEDDENEDDENEDDGNGGEDDLWGEPLKRNYGRFTRYHPSTAYKASGQRRRTYQCPLCGESWYETSGLRDHRISESCISKYQLLF